MNGVISASRDLRTFIVLVKDRDRAAYSAREDILLRR